MIWFWVTTVLVTLIIFIVAALVCNWLHKDYSGKAAIVALIVFILLLAAWVGGTQWWLRNTASGIRLQITWRSEISAGLNRTIYVHSATGVLLHEISGRFDVVHEDGRIMIDVMEEDGTVRRHIFYTTAGSVIGIIEH
ncbi:MAG: hypothetical protein LBG64_01270 [Pseudomonadales bacterium]|jgi:hypothetical protein|nr:hypothetical protein [Pseudomonadales bacterium]